MDGKFFENNLFAVAGDTGRRLEVQLLDSNNMVQNTTGISLRLNANVAGQATYAEATLVDATQGLYELDLPNGMLTAPGNWQFQWQIIGTSGEKLHSFAFTGSIGSNLSEGGSEATNFYLNADELKQMQEDLINGTFNSEVLETNIVEKLTDLETQYAPKLTEVTAQLAKKASINYVDALLMDVAKGGPVDLVYSVSSLNAKYPNGTDGTVLVLDSSFSNGAHLYVWGSAIKKWEDLGEYTPSYVADNSLNTPKISELSTSRLVNNQTDLKNAVFWKTGGSIDAIDGDSFSFTTTVVNNGLAVPVYLNGSDININMFFTANAPVSFSLLDKEKKTVTGSTFVQTGGSRINPVKVEKIFTSSELLNLGITDKCYILFNCPQTGVTTTTVNIMDLLVNNNKGPSNFDEMINEIYTKVLEKVILKVSKTDNSADFTSFVEAVRSITDSSPTNQYEIQLLDAEYDVLSELGGQTFIDSLINNTSEMQGVLLPDYVDLTGMTGGKVKLKMEIPDTGLENVPFFRASTLNLNKTNTLKNLHVIGKNVRYAVHDESNNQTSNYVRTIENCKFEHLGVKESEKNRWLSQTAYACGTGSGSVIKATNTDFIGLKYCGFSAHDNYNFQKPNILVFDNCNFYGQFDVDSIYRASARFEMLGTTTGSGFDGNVFLNNCRFNAPVLNRIYEKGFKIYGGGNTKVPYKINGTNEGNQPLFSDETLTIRAGETIQYGTPVIVKDGKVWSALTDTPSELIKGVLLESVSSGKESTIKVTGYVRGEDLKLSALVAGQKIGVVGGKYAIVTGAEYLGIAEDSVNVILI